MSGYGYPMPYPPQMPGMVPYGYGSPLPPPQPDRRLALPPSGEETGLAALIGATGSALAVQGLCFLGNWQPKSAAMNIGITAAAAAVGGTASALAFRANANKHYQAAQRAMLGVGVDPRTAAMSFRVNGKLGKFGEVDVNLPIDGLQGLFRMYRETVDPFTPPLVQEYYRLAHMYAAEAAAKGFQAYMPPPQAYSNVPMPQPPMYAPSPFYPMYPPQYGQPPAHGSPPPSNP